MNYIDKIRYLPEYVQESIIKESSRTLIRGPLPPELAFVGGALHFTDLGFGNLELAEAEQRTIYEAYMGEGIGVPGTPYKLRYISTMVAVIEPNEPPVAVSLPADWAEVVLVFDANNKPSFIGKRVRPEQYTLFN